MTMTKISTARHYLTLNISETVQNRDTVAMEDEEDLVCDISNGITSNDPCYPDVIKLKGRTLYYVISSQYKTNSVTTPAFSHTRTSLANFILQPRQTQKARADWSTQLVALVSTA